MCYLALAGADQVGIGGVRWQGRTKDVRLNLMNNKMVLIRNAAIRLLQARFGLQDRAHAQVFLLESHSRG